MTFTRLVDPSQLSPHLTPSPPPLRRIKLAVYIVIDAYANANHQMHLRT
jgi:hypothetical protein